MFDNCRAYIAAPTVATARGLGTMAERIGFSDIVGCPPGQPTATDPGVNFFLFHHCLDGDIMAQVIAAVRARPDARLRYAPMILLIDDCPARTVLRYVRMGFDDVISLPERRAIVASRLAAQMHTERLYFETSSYVGPDRARMQAPGPGDSHIAGAHLRLVIRRDPWRGTEILSRQLRGQRAPLRADPATRFAARVFDPARFAAA